MYVKDIKNPFKRKAAVVASVFLLTIAYVVWAIFWVMASIAMMIVHREFWSVLEELKYVLFHPLTLTVEATIEAWEGA